MGVLLAEEPVFSASLGCVSDVKRSEVSRFSNLLRALNLHPWVFRASFLRGVLGVDFLGGAVQDVKAPQACVGVATTSCRAG